MPRKKKVIEPIVGTGRDPENKLTVLKSRPLLSLWQSDMTLAEFKILDTYLSRINSHHPEKRTVIFTKGELEQLLGVTKINKPDLSQRLNNLGRFVEVEKSDHKIHKIALFEEAYGEMDENFQWQVKLTCTPSAMKYIFNIEELGYLRYKLRCITSLTSRYTYVLFMYLESKRIRKTWEVEVDELRRILSCDTEPSYAQFKRFNDLILKKCQKELHEKSECRFTYEPIKKGRKVVAIKFTLETLADTIEPAIPSRLCLDDFADDAEQDLFAGSLPEGLTEEQVEALKALAAPKIKHDPSGLHPWECALADYLRQKTLLMQAHNRKVKHPFSYLKTMIEKDPDA